MAGKREGIATERLRKDPIATAVVDSVPRVPVVSEAGTACDRAADVNIVGHRTVSDTTTDCPGRLDRANERTVGGTPVDSRGLGRAGWMGIQNG